MSVVQWVIGAILLLSGRRLFWLFVGVLGFLAGMSLAARHFPADDQIALLLISLAAGIAGMLAVFVLQKAAVALAGFLAGAMMVESGVNVLQLDVGEVHWLLLVMGGLLGAILLLSFFEWTLVFLTAFTGSGLIVQTLDIPFATKVFFLALLFIISVLVQSRRLKR